jgi:2-methylisocitrate lyase-like PEP mutase family enzyme
LPDASPASRLRELLAQPGLLVIPSCFDALSAKLIERAGFRLAFMSGFAVSAARLGLPDTGLISFGELLDQGRNLCAAVSIPVIGDGDTGFGNAVNVKRTVEGYARAGFAAVMIEDQVAPKRCGHTAGKDVVARDEALTRVRAAVDAREEGADILVLARTDARGPLGIDEALVRCRAFADLGADILFPEAPLSEREMERFCRELPLPVMANMVEEGLTPVLPPARLEALGFKLAAYPLTLLSAAVRAMQQALDALREQGTPPAMVGFAELQQIVGFSDYDQELSRYGDDSTSDSSTNDRAKARQAGNGQSGS